MGQRGPKPAGTGQVIDLPKRPVPPTGMTKRARRLWKEIVMALPVDHFRPQDWPLLRSYCEAEALHFKATAVLDKDGAVIEVTNKFGTSEQRSPWFDVQKQSASTMAMLATKLRMCPNARIDPKRAGRDKPQPESRRKGLMFNG